MSGCRGFFKGRIIYSLFFFAVAFLRFNTAQAVSTSAADSVLTEIETRYKQYKVYQYIRELIELSAAPDIKQNATLMFRLQSNLAFLYRDLGDYHSSIYTITSVWARYKQDSTITTPGEMAILLTDMAGQYEQLDDTTKALAYTNLACNLIISSGKTDLLRYPYEVYGYIFLKTGDVSKSRWYFERCFNWSLTCGDTIGMAYDLDNLGLMELRAGNYQNARKLLNRSFYLTRFFSGTNLIRSSISHHLAEINLKESNYTEALTQLDKASAFLINESSLGALKMKEEIFVLKEKVHQACKDYPNVINAIKQQQFIQKRITDINKQRILMINNIRFDLDKKNELLLMNAIEMEKASISGKRKNIILSISFIALLLLLFFTVNQVFLLKKVRKFNGLLIQKTKLINDQRLKIEEQQELLRQQVTQLEYENLMSKYEMIKSQIDPHFLFNTLNLLRSCISQSREEATELVTSIALFYRTILQKSDHVLSSLKDELKMVQTYVSIQSMRHKDCFSFNISVEPDVYDLKVPSHSLQIVVENIFKHNMLTRDLPVLINIYSHRQHLYIENDIRVKMHEYESSKTGQKNIISRYKLLGKDLPEFTRTNQHYTAKIPLLYDE